MTDPTILTVTVTRSAGSDGALLVMLDTTEDTGPIRVLLNDDKIHADVDFTVFREDREARDVVLTVQAADVAYTPTLASQS